MTNLIEFFNKIVGFDVLSMDSNPINYIIVIFGFFIVYDVIHIVFGSVFDFTHKK
ncbi:MAG: hypothetical protein NC122_00615 [Faecalibacterium sp.]|nr:hypothetical protein [Ruminococcus sp.]MCM1484690.1 hypothetical protein [Faecalibacterium sp.]